MGWEDGLGGGGVSVFYVFFHLDLHSAALEYITYHIPY